MKLNLISALKQPFTGNNWALSILIGSAIAVVGSIAAQYGVIGQIVQFIASAFIGGYVIRVAHNAVESSGTPALPSWNEAPKQLVFQGIIGSGGMTIWSVIFALCAIALTAVVAAAIGAPLATTQGLTGAGGIALLSGLVMTVLFMPFLALICVHYAATGNYMAFVEVRAVLQRVRANLGGTVLALILSGIVLSITGATLTTPAAGVLLYDVGLVLHGVLTFVGYLIVANLWAQVYRGSKS